MSESEMDAGQLEELASTLRSDHVIDNGEALAVSHAGLAVLRSMTRGELVGLRAVVQDSHDTHADAEELEVEIDRAVYWAVPADTVFVDSWVRGNPDREAEEAEAMSQALNAAVVVVPQKEQGSSQRIHGFGDHDRISVDPGMKRFALPLTFEMVDKRQVGDVEKAAMDNRMGASDADKLRSAVEGCDGKALNELCEDRAFRGMDPDDRDDRVKELMRDRALVQQVAGTQKIAAEMSRVEKRLHSLNYGMGRIEQQRDSLIR